MSLVTFRGLSLNVQLFIWRKVTNVKQILISNVKLVESLKWSSPAKIVLNQERDFDRKTAGLNIYYINIYKIYLLTIDNKIVPENWKVPVSPTFKV